MWEDTSSLVLEIELMQIFLEKYYIVDVGPNESFFHQVGFQLPCKIYSRCKTANIEESTFMCSGVLWWLLTSVTYCFVIVQWMCSMQKILYCTYRTPTKGRKQRTPAKYRHDENVIESKPIVYRQIVTAEILKSEVVEYYTGSCSSIYTQRWFVRNELAITCRVLKIQMQSTFASRVPGYWGQQWRS